MLLPVLLFHHADIGLIQTLFCFLQPLIGPHFVGVIGVFTHLKRGFRLLIRLQSSGHGYVVILVRILRLTVKLVAGCSDSLLHRMRKL